MVFSMRGFNHSSNHKATIVKSHRDTVPTMVDYKDRLSEAMKNAGKTTSSLAGDLGLTYQAIDKVLKGNTKELTASNNSKAALLLNVNTDWLATGKGPRNRTAAEEVRAAEKPAGYLSPSEVAELISLYAVCDDKARALVMEEARSASARFGKNGGADDKRDVR